MTKPRGGYSPEQVAAQRKYQRGYHQLKKHDAAYKDRRKRNRQNYLRGIQGNPLRAAKYNARCNERNYFKKYGITRTEKEAILQRQNGACAVCGTTQPVTFRPWHLDHDHVAKRVRGVLCHHCNVAAGAVRDSPSIAIKLAAYLKSKQL